MLTFGFIKLAVPISTALAPTSKNSIASAVFCIPPIPITGIFTLCDTCHTHLRAIGLIAGPDKPPVMVEIIGFLLSLSTAIANTVLIKERESAPAFSIS